MSKQRAKGTRAETAVLERIIRPVFPDAERTGSNHSTRWGKADYMNTDDYVWEVKNWENWVSALREGWRQVTQTARDTGLNPHLAVRIPHSRMEDTLILTNARSWLKDKGAELGG